jgi:hypothetical protein
MCKEATEGVVVVKGLGLDDLRESLLSPNLRGHISLKFARCSR